MIVCHRHQAHILFSAYQCDRREKSLRCYVFKSAASFQQNLNRISCPIFQLAFLKHCDRFIRERSILIESLKNEFIVVTVGIMSTEKETLKENDIQTMK